MARAPRAKRKLIPLPEISFTREDREAIFALCPGYRDTYLDLLSHWGKPVADRYLVVISRPAYRRRRPEQNYGTKRPRDKPS